MKNLIYSSRVKSKLFIFFSLSFIGLFSGCNKSEVGNIREGEIHYNIVYNGRIGTIPEDLMPSSMVVKFKDNKTMFEITTPIGNNGIFNVVDPDEKKIDTYIRIFGMKYFYSGPIDEVPPGIDPMLDLKITLTDKTSEIFGLKCRNALAEIPGSGFSFDLWYTDDIKIDDPNQSTPFKQIDGVLISFFYKMGDMIVEFEADGVYGKSISDSEFIKNENYKQITRKDMDSIISKMMSL